MSFFFRLYKASPSQGHPSSKAGQVKMIISTIGKRKTIKTNKCEDKSTLLSFSIDSQLF